MEREQDIQDSTWKKIEERLIGEFIDAATANQEIATDIGTKLQQCNSQALTQALVTFFRKRRIPMPLDVCTEEDMSHKEQFSRFIIFAWQEDERAHAIADDLQQVDRDTFRNNVIRFLSSYGKEDQGGEQHTHSTPEQKTSARRAAIEYVLERACWAIIVSIAAITMMNNFKSDSKRKEAHQGSPPPAAANPDPALSRDQAGTASDPRQWSQNPP